MQKGEQAAAEPLPADFYRSVADILRKARANAYRAINFTMVEAYWNVGRKIVEEEQQGKERAGYGEALVQNLSERLTLDLGKGFSASNLWAFKRFYSAFPILHTLCGESSETPNQEHQKGSASSIPAILSANEIRIWAKPSKGGGQNVPPPPCLGVRHGRRASETIEAHASIIYRAGHFMMRSNKCSFHYLTKKIIENDADRDCQGRTIFPGVNVRKCQT